MYSIFELFRVLIDLNLDILKTGPYSSFKLEIFKFQTRKSLKKFENASFKSSRVLGSNSKKLKSKILEIFEFYSSYIISIQVMHFLTVDLR